jgi:hypothetical protein
MKKIIRLTESDLARIVGRVIKEEYDEDDEVEVTPEMIIKMLMDSAESTPQENYDDLYDWMQDVFSPVESELEDMGYDIDDLRMTYDDVIMSLWDDNDEDDEESLYESDLARIVKQVISESKKNLSKSEILKMSKDELKDVYGELEVKGEYHGNKGTFHHFKRTAIGDIVCSFRTDDSTPSGLKRNTQGIKVKNLDF